MVRLSVLSIGLMALVLVLFLAVPALAADTSGKLKSIDADKNQFVMTDTNNKDWTFHLNRDAKVFINDKPSKLSDLQAGDEVKITYEKEGEKLNASEVRCTRK